MRPFAVTMKSLLQRCGVRKEQVRLVTRDDRAKVRRAARAAGYVRCRYTKSPYGLRRRRAKNRVARATRRAQRLAR